MPVDPTATVERTATVGRTLAIDPTTIYDGLTFPSPPPDRPFVYVNMVATVDGKSTLARGAHPRPIGSEVDRTLMVRLRIHADAVLRGAGTVRRNPYYPAVRSDGEERRRARGAPAQPLACVVSGSGAIDPDLAFFRRAPRRPVIFVGPQAEPGALAALEAVADVHRAPRTDRVPMADRAPSAGSEEQPGRQGPAGVEGPAAGRRQPAPQEPAGSPGDGGSEEPAGTVPVRWMLSVLREQYGVRYLLCEGGPTLNFALFQAGCVDELFVTVAPFVAGHGGDLTLVHGPRLLQPFPELGLLSAFFHEGELFLRYAVKRGTPAP